MKEKDNPQLRLAFKTDPLDISKAGEVSTRVRKELKKLNICPEVIRKVSIICFEGEMNIALHAEKGGTVTVEVWSEKIDILFKDSGPGIKDINLALLPGYSTAPQWAIELGFGAGMGFYNMQRNSDFFKISSNVGKGTKIYSRVYINKCKESKYRGDNFNEAKKNC